MLPKAWRHTNDGIYLYKGGTTGTSNPRREPYCEYYASQIAENMALEDICAEVMGPKQKEQLRRMIGFHFKRNEILNLPQEHLQAIEST